MATAIALDPTHVEDLLLCPSADGRARFSRQAYHRMSEAGILGPHRRVELVDGVIFMMSPIGPPQGSLITRLCDFFTRGLENRFQCRIQLPIVVRDHSEPEPDVAIVQRRDDDYQHEHPLPNEVELLIEVAQTSLDFDLGMKLRLYASSGIREYWVIDVGRQQILVHRNPAGNQYRDVSPCRIGDKIAPLAAANCQLDVAWLFH